MTVDARHGTTTGISAADRAATIHALVDPATRPGDLARPGHVFPLALREGGVLKRGGHTEAAVDLARMAGLYPAGVLCEIVDEDKTTMARLPELERFADEHGLLLISHRRPHPLPAPDREAGQAGGRGPHPHRVGRLHLLRLRVAARRRAARGPRAGRGAGRGQRARAGAQRVPHRRRLRLAALRLRPPARRGHANGSPEAGSASSSTCGATRAGASASPTSCGPTRCRSRATTPSTPTSSSGLPVDSREYGIGAQILVDLGITTMRLLTNNPAKYGGLEGFGLEIVERVPLQSVPNPENIRYLRTKQQRMGHLLEGLE